MTNQPEDTGIGFGAGLSSAAIAEILQPYIFVPSLSPIIYDQLARYLELLLKWNARMNLTAIREPEEVVRRHFGESLFAAQHLNALGDPCETLLDFGSGAGFPGIPIQLFHPRLNVTLAESQNKKATFLRETIRTLGLKTLVWADRVEAIPPGRRFDVVTLRAVDNMPEAIAAAVPRVGDRMLLLTTSGQQLDRLPGFSYSPGINIPASDTQQLLFLTRNR
jgi:16S rRNA (guanine527-N7)-methyltransferase